MRIRRIRLGVSVYLAQSGYLDPIPQPNSNFTSAITVDFQ